MFLSRDDKTQMVGLIRRLHIVRDDADLAAIMGMQQTKSVIVSWLNAHALILAIKDKNFRDNLLQSQLIFRDGIGLSLLLKGMGIDAGLNMNGTDLIPRILSLHAGKKVALFGTQEPYVSQAAGVVKKMGCDVVAVMDGFQKPEAYAQKISETQPDVIVLAMGMPKQEQVAALLAQQANYPVLILNGGAILDFMAKRFPRAPRLIRRLRMEWLFRLANEPRRLWRRYILGGFGFAVYSFQLILAARAAPQR